MYGNRMRKSSVFLNSYFYTIVFIPDSDKKLKKLVDKSEEFYYFTKDKMLII